MRIDLGADIGRCQKKRQTEAYNQENTHIRLQYMGKLLSFFY